MNKIEEAAEMVNLLESEMVNLGDWLADHENDELNTTDIEYAIQTLGAAAEFLRSMITVKAQVAMALFGDELGD